MSLVLEALNKAKQQTPGNKGGDPAHLQIMTGGMQPEPSATSRVGVLIGAAIGVVGVMLAIAVLVVGVMLKPAPQAAHADVTGPVPTPVIDAPQEPIVAAASPILEVQPFLQELMQESPPVVESPTPARMLEPEKPIAPESVKSPEVQAPAPTPAPAVAAKEPLKPDTEYVQTLDVSDAPQIKLGAVIWSDTLKVALINGATMQSGESVGGVKLLEIEPKRVKLEYGEKAFWLRLP